MVSKHVPEWQDKLYGRCGLSMRKTCDNLGAHFGLSLSPGGLSQALDRIRDRPGPVYEPLIRALRPSPAVYADETGWWKGGVSAWLWTIANSLMTLYPGRHSHSHPTPQHQCKALDRYAASLPVCQSRR